MQALTKLRPEYRQVLELGILQGLSHAEIATHLDMPRGTVKSNMRRGLMRVRECMNKDNAPESVETPPVVRVTTIENQRSVVVVPILHHAVALGVSS